MPIRHTNEATARFQRMRRTPILAEIGEELHAGAQAIVEDAQFSIRDGAISGSGHKPSPPGSPPNEDTGNLAESIHRTPIIETTREVRTSVVVDEPYGLPLERGTSNMVERPFLGPATRRQHLHIFEALVGRARQIWRRR